MQQETALARIREIVEEALPDCRVLLFGSRARGEARVDSDYDILILTQFEMDILRKMEYIRKINRHLVREGIVCDILLQSEQDARDLENCTASVVREALDEGIPVG